MRRSAWACLPFALMSIAGGSAFANITPTLTTESTTAGITTWDYSAELDNTEEVEASQPSELCLANIPDLVMSGATAPTGWTVTGYYTNGCPNGLLAGTPTTNNKGDAVLYTYVGTTLSGAPSGVALGTFSFETTISTEGSNATAYGAQAIKLSPVGPDANQGQVNGPQAMPEPATLSLLFAGLAGVVVFGRKRLAEN